MMSQELLDEQIAARIRAECRDANDLHRFQRAVYIAETILEAYGLPKTVKAVRKLRVHMGLIPEDPPEPPAIVDAYTPAVLAGDADPLTGRRRKKRTEATNA